MPHRSQVRRQAIHGYRPVITDLQPRAATIAAAGVVGRTIATMTPTGGVMPYKYALTVPAGLAAAFTDNKLLSTVNPIGTAGLKNATVVVTDGIGRTFSITLAVTLT